MPSLKESIGLSNPQDASTSTQWPVQAEVPGFKEKMLDFHEVRIIPYLKLFLDESDCTHECKSRAALPSHIGF